MALSKPKVRLRKKSSNETLEEHTRRASERDSECAEEEFRRRYGREEPEAMAEVTGES